MSPRPPTPPAYCAPDRNSAPHSPPAWSPVEWTPDADYRGPPGQRLYPAPAPHPDAPASTPSTPNATGPQHLPPNPAAASAAEAATPNQPADRTSPKATTTATDPHPAAAHPAAAPPRSTRATRRQVPPPGRSCAATPGQPPLHDVCQQPASQPPQVDGNASQFPGPHRPTSRPQNGPPRTATSIEGYLLSSWAIPATGRTSTSVYRLDTPARDADALC